MTSSRIIMIFILGWLYGCGEDLSTSGEKENLRITLELEELDFDPDQLQTEGEVKELSLVSCSRKETPLGCAVDLKQCSGHKQPWNRRLVCTSKHENSKSIAKHYAKQCKNGTDKVWVRCTNSKEYKGTKNSLLGPSTAKNTVQKTTTQKTVQNKSSSTRKVSKRVLPRNKLFSRLNKTPKKKGFGKFLGAFISALSKAPKNRITVTCQSFGYRTKVCQMPRKVRVIKSVKVKKQLSRASCNSGFWRTKKRYHVKDKNKLVVTKGCRAVFDITYK